MRLLRIESTLLGLLLMLVFCTSSCSTLGRITGLKPIPDSLEREEVRPAVTRSREYLSNGDPQRAMEWMQAAAATAGLEPALKREVRELLEECSRARIRELAAEPVQPDELAAFLELELPRQISVEAVLIAAKELNRDEEYLDSFRLIKKLDVKYPTHHLRSDAGRILAEAGMEVSRDESNFLFFFPRRDRAKEVLEYLVLNYPSERRCPEAYATLAWLYELDEDWELSIERHQDLLLYHPDSPSAITSEARIPNLRLSSITSPEYDRQQLVRARDELQAWLERHPGMKLEGKVRLDLTECFLRLHESDMGIARFYVRVDNDFGARFHSTRAIGEAQAANDSDREEEAVAFLATLPPAPPAVPALLAAPAAPGEAE